MFINIFSEYWEEHFNCEFHVRPPRDENVTVCSGTEELKLDPKKFANDIRAVSNAVLVYAHAVQ